MAIWAILQFPSVPLVRAPLKTFVVDEMQKFTTFLRSTAGATLVEYGVALLVVIIVGAGALSALGTAVGTTLQETASAF